MLEQLMRGAGFTDITIDAIPMTFEFESLDQHWEITRALAAPVKRAAETLPADKLRQWRSALGDALAPFMAGDRVRVTATPLCATGRK